MTGNAGRRLEFLEFVTSSTTFAPGTATVSNAGTSSGSANGVIGQLSEAAPTETTTEPSGNTIPGRNSVPGTFGSTT